MGTKLESKIDMADYPLQKHIWPGAILGSIAHAIFVAKCPDLSNEQSWDGNNFNVQDSAGSRATIAFSNAFDRFVAVAFYWSSRRNPFTATGKLDDSLSGLPGELQPLADEALQYVFQDLNGREQPVVTAAFWGDGKGQLASGAHDWDDELANGAILFETQFRDIPDALNEWSAKFELTLEQTRLVKLIFDRKIANPTATIELGKFDYEVLDVREDNDDGAEAMRESFTEIGVIVDEEKETQLFSGHD